MGLIGERGGRVGVEWALAIGMATIRSEREKRSTHFMRRLARRLDAFPGDLAIARMVSRVTAPLTFDGVRRLPLEVPAFPCALVHPGIHARNRTSRG